MSAKSISVDEAVAALEAAAWRWRTVSRDGKPERWAYGAFVPFLEQLGMGWTWEMQPLYAGHDRGHRRARCC